MSLFQQRSDFAGPWPPAQAYLPPRVIENHGRPRVNNETALRHSAVWASLRLRANLISTMDVQSWRKVGGLQVQVPNAPILVDPSGDGTLSIDEFLFATQWDLDRAGNAFGLIVEKNSLGLPAAIQLIPVDQVTAVMKGTALKAWKIGGQEVDTDLVWHEKQYPVPGLAVGLSPIAHAAYAIGEYLSIQDFAADWFGKGGIPSAHLKNTAKTLTPEEANTAKERFRASTKSGEAWVSGQDWEFQLIQGANTGNDWVNAKNFSITDIARFFDVPGDLIDAAVQGSSITYANQLQRNTQFLVMHLNPAIKRRERTLSKLLPQPRTVTLDRESILEMDPVTMATFYQTMVNTRSMTPDEIREQRNMAPLTEDQINQILTFWPPHSTYDPNAPLKGTASGMGL